jgi:hypothetical protein
MIEQPNPLSLKRQCELLGLSRAALYYRAVEVSGYELELMALIDRQYLRTFDSLEDLVEIATDPRVDDLCICHVSKHGDRDPLVAGLLASDACDTS